MVIDMELFFTILKWLFIGFLSTTIPSSPSASRIAFKITPITVYAIIVLNIVVYVLMIVFNWYHVGFFNYEVYDGICQRFGFRPSLFFAQSRDGSLDILSVAISALSLLTYQFLHGGFLHLLFNMMALHVFGPSVESGQNIKFNAYTRKAVNTYFPFPIFYLICGVGSALLHLTVAWFSGEEAFNTVLVGASGAISGVMGAYLLGRWKDYNKITLRFLLIFPVQTSINWYILYWFIAQVVIIFMYGANTPVSYSGHVGGFITGILLWIFVTPWINNAARPNARGWFCTKR